MAEGGMTVTGLLPKLGYRGIDSTAMRLDAHRVPASAVLGGNAGVGRGLQQMLSGVEVGRVNVAARAIGTARRAYELAMAYALEREAFGQRLADLQAIQFKLADMGTKIAAARLLAVAAARSKDAGSRADVETGMAKLFASEMCHEVVLEAMRIHGGNGYSKEYEIERLYRDAPMLLLGEGTSEIQRTIVARGLVRRWEEAHDGT
jgi:butyryl-CoA dehydrogenase